GEQADVAALVRDWTPERWQQFVARRQACEPLARPESGQALVLNALLLETLLREEVSRSLVGLALSGGGIRSASFNLGLLQALYEQGQLRRADYLATVSGGGYIGSLLSSLMLRPDVHLNDREHFPLMPAQVGKQPERPETASPVQNGQALMP